MDRVRIIDHFHRNFEERGELGASLCVWIDGEPVLNLAEGFQDRERTIPWTQDTSVLFWSATKALSASCVLHACQLHSLTLEEPVAHFWPEFAAGGKSGITIGQVLSHQAGLPALSTPVSVTDYDAVIDALAREVPHWRPGDGQGYHPRTFGFLLDEIVRRITGISLRTYWRQVFEAPLGLNLWIGVDPELAGAIAPVFPARTTLPKDDLFYSAFMESGSLTARSFASPRGLHSATTMNTPEARTASLPAFGGTGTAASLAKFYAMLAGGGSLNGKTFFRAPAMEWMTTTRVQGPDRVLQIQTAFSAGFMKDPVGPNGKLRTTYGPSLKAFGHPGAGGSHAFADPENRIAFAYLMNQMEPGVLPNTKSLGLVEALYA